jgi:hypothetical protein
MVRIPVAPRSAEDKVAAGVAAARGELPSGRSGRGRRPRPTSLAPGSPPSRPLRAASGGGLRPVLTAAARGAASATRSGRRNGARSNRKTVLPSQSGNVTSRLPMETDNAQTPPRPASHDRRRATGALPRQAAPDPPNPTRGADATRPAAPTTLGGRRENAGRVARRISRLAGQVAGKPRRFPGGGEAAGHRRDRP